MNLRTLESFGTTFIDLGGTNICFRSTRPSGFEPRTIYLGQLVQVSGDGVTDRVSHNLRSGDLAWVVGIISKPGESTRLVMIPDKPSNGYYEPSYAKLKRIERVLAPVITGEPYEMRFDDLVFAGLPVLDANNPSRRGLLFAVRELSGEQRVHQLGDWRRIIYNGEIVEGYISSIHAGSIEIKAQRPYAGRIYSIPGYRWPYFG